MAGCVIQVWFAPEAQLRDWPFELVETEFADFAEAARSIDAGGLVGGERLITRRSEVFGERIVTRRVPIAFRASGVVRLELPQIRLVEEQSDG
jgi:hypothetical protein